MFYIHDIHWLDHLIFFCIKLIVWFKILQWGVMQWGVMADICINGSAVSQTVVCLMYFHTVVYYGCRPVQTCLFLSVCEILHYLTTGWRHDHSWINVGPWQKYLKKNLFFSFYFEILFCFESCSWTFIKFHEKHCSRSEKMCLHQMQTRYSSWIECALNKG